MTIEDLHDQGVLLPEREWGKHSLETTTKQWWLLAAFIVAGAALIAALAGDGGLLTWAGVGIFLLMLYALVLMCDRAVRRQRERVRRERKPGTK